MELARGTDALLVSANESGPMKRRTALNPLRGSAPGARHLHGRMLPAHFCGWRPVARGWRVRNRRRRGSPSARSRRHRSARADIALAGPRTAQGRLLREFECVNHAPVVPARIGARNADAPVTASTDRLTVVFVPEGTAATLSVPMSSTTSPLIIDVTEPGCAGAGVCGFTNGTRAVVVDTSGVGAGHEFFTVTGYAGGLAHDGANPPFARVWRRGVCGPQSSNAPTSIGPATG